MSIACIHIAEFTVNVRVQRHIVEPVSTGSDCFHGRGKNRGWCDRGCVGHRHLEWRNVIHIVALVQC